MADEEERQQPGALVDEQGHARPSDEAEPTREADNDGHVKEHSKEEGNEPRHEQAKQGAVEDGKAEPKEEGGTPPSLNLEAPAATEQRRGSSPSRGKGGAGDGDKDREKDRRDRDRKEGKSRDGDRGRDERRDKSDKDRRDDKKSSRRSRSRDRSKDRRRRSRSKDRKAGSSRRSRSDSRDKRRRRSSRSKSRDRKSSRRSRSRDRRRSRSRDRGGRRSSRRSPSSSSSEDIGGYKPRKRQDPLVITNGPGTGADPYASMRTQVQIHDPQAQLKAWQLQQLEARAMVLEQQSKSAATATSKTQREVYVGGLAAGAVSPEALRTLFNSALAVQFAGFLMPGMDPVININMHPEGKYAFVEFRAPEMASAALALSGQVQLLGCTLSVARPSGYVDPSRAQNASKAAGAAVEAFRKGDMIALATAAINGANLKGLGLPPHIEDPEAAAQALPPGVSQGGISVLPTRFLVFLGMVTADRLKNDQEYNDMKEDLVDQFNEFTPESCEELKVPRPYDPALADQYLGIGDFGKIFARLSTLDAAQLCKSKIHGRMYGGSPVYVFFIDEETFNAVSAV